MKKIATLLLSFITVSAMAQQPYRGTGTSGSQTNPQVNHNRGTSGGSTGGSTQQSTYRGNNGNNYSPSREAVNRGGNPTPGGRPAQRPATGTLNNNSENQQQRANEQQKANILDTTGQSFTQGPGVNPSRTDGDYTGDNCGCEGKIILSPQEIWKLKDNEMSSIFQNPDRYCLTPSMWAVFFSRNYYAYCYF
jgi:hypothetical protein